jgi:hypothetical protein
MIEDVKDTHREPAGSPGIRGEIANGGRSRIRTQASAPAGRLSSDDW